MKENSTGWFMPDNLREEIRVLSSDIVDSAIIIDQSTIDLDKFEWSDWKRATEESIRKLVTKSFHQGHGMGWDDLYKRCISMERLRDSYKTKTKREGGAK